MFNQTKNKQKESSKLYKRCMRYRWAQDSGDIFFKALNSPDMFNKIFEFRGNPYDTTKEGVNLATADINTLFHEAAIKANLAKVKRQYKKKQNNKKMVGQRMLKSLKRCEKNIKLKTSPIKQPRFTN